MPEQLDFFSALGEVPPASDNEAESAFEWSYSRRGVLEQCPRRYYYNYYGANARVAKTEPQKEELRFLKQLSNCYLRSGDILHLVIRTYLKRLRSREEWTLDRMLRWAQGIFRHDLDFSQRYQVGDSLPHAVDSPVLLLEYYYNVANAKERWANSEEQLVTALTNLRESPALTDFRTGATREKAEIESPVILKDGNFSMRGKVDLAFPNDRRFVVVDWKIGNSDDSGESLQLTSYAMGAINKLGCTPEDIDLYRVQLGSGLVSQFAVSSKSVLRARSRIIQDVDKMKALDDYGRNAIAEVFTPCAQSRICASCCFQAVCPKELKNNDRDEYSDTDTGI